MNDTRYGLTAGVYTRDEARAARHARAGAARAASTGTAATASARACRGRAHGDSGIGLTLSTYGIQTFTRPRPGTCGRPDWRRRALTRLALFDLDGTLLAGDTDVLWCAFLVDEGVLDRASFGAANREVAARYARGAITPDEFAGFYAATLAGRSAAAWAPLRARFVTSEIEPRIAAASRALVVQHRDAGDRLVLTTATNRFLSEPIAASLGIAELIATELDVAASGEFSGRTSGVVNMRAGKVARLATWLATQGEAASTLADAIFYSDSINDLPLLEAVATPVVVDPDPRLHDEALRRGWRVLRLA